MLLGGHGLPEKLFRAGWLRVNDSGGHQQRSQDAHRFQHSGVALSWGEMHLPRLIIWALALTAMVGAQAPPKEQFEDLARCCPSHARHPPRRVHQGLFKQALAIRPEWAEGWLYLGGALFRLNRFAEATDALRKGLEIAPGIGTGWALLGLTESQLEDQDQALTDIRKGEGIGLGSNRGFEVAVRVRAAQMLVKSSAFDEALAQLQPLAKYPETVPPVEEAMGLCALSIPEDVSQLTPQRRAVVDLAGKAAWAFASQRPEDAAHRLPPMARQ